MGAEVMTYVHQAISWSSTGLLLTGALENCYSEIVIKVE